jgi:TetR/AcrR family tetracycline transcriptional repressor
MAFLAQAGVPQRDAQFAMLAASRFTVGSVLEEQAEAHGDTAPGESAALRSMDHALAFEEGLRLIMEGLTRRVAEDAR